MTIQNKVIYFLCFVLLLSLSVKSLVEPDVWWQLRTGEWIVEHKSVPTQDVLSYTYDGDPWVNIKWGSEVLFYFLATYSSPELIPFFVGILYCLLFYFLIKTLSYFGNFIFDNAFALSSILFMICISHRINGRPEVISYLLTTLFLWTFHKSRKQIMNKIELNAKALSNIKLPK